MEYLMTYGWAILIIAVVLGAIYSLGLFNLNTLGPRATPGSCQVYRPNGPASTAYINLAGVCTNQLPQYVAYFNSQGYITMPYAVATETSNSFTASLWIRSTLGGSGTGVFDTAQDVGCYGDREIVNTNIDFQSTLSNATLCKQALTTSTVPQVGQWYDMVITYNSTGISNNWIIYINGVQSAISTLKGPLNAVPSGSVGYIGGFPGYQNFNGLIANLQLYNTSLDANTVKILYLSGIGGNPVQLQNMVGWWPLNGNANDYSGNLNNGAPTSITYTNQWLGGYNVP